MLQHYGTGHLVYSHCTDYSQAFQCGEDLGMRLQNTKVLFYKIAHRRYVKTQLMHCIKVCAQIWLGVNFLSTVSGGSVGLSRFFFEEKYCGAEDHGLNFKGTSSEVR